MPASRYRPDWALLINGLLLWLLCSPVHADSQATEPLLLNCKSGINVSQLACTYQLHSNETVTRVKARASGLELQVPPVESYPWTNATTAVLLLVDTSDPARQPVIEQNRKHIAQLLNAAKPYHRIALASFDSSLRLLVPPGMNGEKILQATAELRAEGKTTELYRSILSAIDILREYQADRKALILFSDGLAEDRAYYHDDVIKAAQNAGVMIAGLGYQRSVSEAVALQTIRRLSEETGGLYTDTGADFSLPVDFAGQIFRHIDNGGRFTIDLAPLGTVDDPDEKISVTFITATGDHTLDVPLPHHPVAEAAASTDTPAIATAQPAKSAQSVQIITREVPQEKSGAWIWYGILAFLITILLCILIAFLVTYYRQEKKAVTRSKSSAMEFRPYAYLVVQDQTKKRYPITRTMWRIGRGKDNEMTLADSSVSRRHAEISRDKGDVFTLIDLDSLNGVYVNNHKVSRHQLHEGDIIEIGDIHLRFTLLSADYALEEATAMQNTRAPYH